MAYTAKSAKAFRTAKGSLAEKIAGEFALVDAELAVVQAGERTLANTKIFVGDGDGLAQGVNMSGDATIANTGAVTIAAKAVTLAKTADLATGSLIIGAADNRPAAIDVKGDGKILVGNGATATAVSLSGDVTLANTGAVTIAANAVGSTEIAASYGKVVKVPLVEGVENAIAFAWQNPEASEILVHRVLVHVTTAGGTVGATLNVGKVANATSTASDIINAIDIATPAVLSSSTCTTPAVLDANGGANDFITGKILGADAAALVGNVYIWYITV